MIFFVHKYCTEFQEWEVQNIFTFKNACNIETFYRYWIKYIIETNYYFVCGYQEIKVTLQFTSLFLPDINILINADLI